MSQQMRVDKDEVLRTINNIVEIVANITASSTNFRQQVEEQFRVDDTGYLKTVATRMAEAEAAAKATRNDFIDIQEKLGTYLRQFEEFTEDTSGF